MVQTETKLFTQVWNFDSPLPNPDDPHATQFSLKRFILTGLRLGEDEHILVLNSAFMYT